MRTLSIDIETFSPTKLPSAGVYRYAADPGFDLLLFAYSVDDGPVHVISTATGEQIPAEITDALTDPEVTKWAYNASFERVCISAWLHQTGQLHDTYLDPAGWKCSMVASGALGLPLGLKNVGQALNLDAQKIDQGKDLITYFCVPTRGSAAKTPALFDAEGLEHRNMPNNAPEKWLDFIEYCRRDVEVENELRAKISSLPLPDWVWEDYWIDQKINDHGIRVDIDLAQAAINIDTAFRAHCTDEAQELTGLDNPNSPTALQKWLTDNGVPVASMAKDDIADALSIASGTPKRVLELRQNMSRSSVKKYEAMLKSAVPTDNRAHGLLQFMGAGRTGRWAGRLIQVQNLPRNYLPDLDQARELVRAGDAEALELLYDSVPDTLSQLIRTAFIPAEGRRFIVADYSAIEARVLAWLAGQESTLDAFRRGEEIYCATASMMFGVPVEKHGINGHLRDKGKVAVLACGYQGGVNAMKAMGGERMGMTEPEMKDTVTKWRHANDKVVNYWYRIDEAAQKAIITGQPQQVRDIRMQMRAGALTITLPSGRDLVYPGARIGQNRFGNVGLMFKGIGLNKKAQQEDTYGGKLVENITQAVARDLLAYALAQVHAAGHRIVIHVHDEIVVEAPPATTVEEICDLMAQAPHWAQGLPLEADGYDCNYYQKD